MATRTLTITYSDANAPRFNQALKAHYGQIEDPVGSGIYRDRTTAEAWAEFERGCKSALKDIVRRVERDAAVAQAAASVVEPEVQ